MPCLQAQAAGLVNAFWLQGPLCRQYSQPAMMLSNQPGSSPVPCLQAQAASLVGAVCGQCSVCDAAGTGGTPRQLQCKQPQPAACLSAAGSAPCPSRLLLVSTCYFLRAAPAHPASGHERQPAACCSGLNSDNPVHPPVCPASLAVPPL